MQRRHATQRVAEQVERGQPDGVDERIEVGHEVGRRPTLAFRPRGPAVPAGILKYHLTEFGRMVANDAMDVQGGKGIMLGPRNYLGRGYQMVPVSITVEGANILTRSLIIFGQGAVRCHPFVLKEMNAAQDTDRERGLRDFDVALFGHIRFTISNAVRSFIAAVTLSRIVKSPRAITGSERRSSISRR